MGCCISSPPKPLQSGKGLNENVIAYHISNNTPKWPILVLDTNESNTYENGPSPAPTSKILMLKDICYKMCSLFSSKDLENKFQRVAGLPLITCNTVELGIYRDFIFPLNFSTKWGDVHFIGKQQVHKGIEKMCHQYETHFSIPLYQCPSLLGIVLTDSFPVNEKQIITQLDIIFGKFAAEIIIICYGCHIQQLVNYYTNLSIKYPKLQCTYFHNMNEIDVIVQQLLKICGISVDNPVDNSKSEPVESSMFLPSVLTYDVGYPVIVQ
jgi:hypothetical protein